MSLLPVSCNVQTIYFGTYAIVPCIVPSVLHCKSAQTKKMKWTYSDLETGALSVVGQELSYIITVQQFAMYKYIIGQFPCSTLLTKNSLLSIKELHSDF